MVYVLLIYRVKVKLVLEFKESNFYGDFIDEDEFVKKFKFLLFKNNLNLKSLIFN